jgi:Ca-activated chloride channel family protein
MSCPTTDTLEQLALGFLEDEAGVRQHAKGCRACARTLEILGGEHAALATAAKDVRLPRIAPPRATPGRRPFALVARLWRPLAVTAAATVGLLGIVFLTQASKEAPPGAGTSAKVAKVPSEWSWWGGGRDAERENVPAPTSTAPRREPKTYLDASHLLLTAPAEPLKPVPPGVAKPDPLPPQAIRPPGPSSPKADVTFRNPGLNPAVDPRKDPLSTFALDVDTASYTIVRRYLMDGQLPPADAVRLEEFVNYFRYADPRPPQGAFQVLLEAAPSPFDPALHLLRIAVQAREIAETERKDCILTFVIDVSGSMSLENRLALVKRSVRALVERLRPTDRVGIVVYGTNGRKLLDPTPARRRAEILGVVEELQPEGSTNLEDGLLLGYDLAAKHFNPRATNRVIVCTDGVANNGVIDPGLLVKKVADQASRGIWLSVLGFGMENLNDDLMETLADKGKGNYAYIDDFREAKKIFTEKLTGMLEVVAADAKVQVEFDPRTVSEFRQLGYENRRLAHADFRNDRAVAGEVGANHHVTALYEMKLRPGAEGRLATVRLRYKEPDTKEVVESQESLGLGQVLGSVGGASPSYRLAASVAQFAEILREGPRAKAVTLRRVLEEASRASEELGRPEDAAEFTDLVRRAAGLKK